MPGYAQPNLQWNSAMSATEMYPPPPKKKRRKGRRKKIKGIVVPPLTSNIVTGIPLGGNNL
jgi:hypothetical protein